MKVGINGFGRIGRAIFRIMWNRKNMDCVYVNEPFGTIEDIAYFLKYDSLYGRFWANVDIIDDNTLKVSSQNNTLYTHISHFEDVSEFCDILKDDVYIIESCGKPENVLFYKNHSNRKAIFTLSSTEIISEIILGVNQEKLLDSKINFISGSICDAVALAPVLKSVFDNANIDQTIITTMHPALSYQKVIDNYTSSDIHRSLGRQYIDSIIPKRTSAEKVLLKFYPDKKIRCMSFRIPTESVCAANITFISKSPINLNNIVSNLNNKEEIEFCYDDLVSIDFKASMVSATVDMRWTEVIDNNILRMTIWYDNEYGYSSKIIDLLELWDRWTTEGGYAVEDWNIK